MLKACFVDFSYNLYDKHPAYCLGSYLASNGTTVDYILARTFKDALSAVANSKPDLLLYSSFTSDISTFVNFDKLVKEQFTVKSVMGGPGPTYDWSTAANGTIDCFCIGEGEVALAEYIDSGFQRGKNLLLNGDKQPEGFHEFVDLDTLPFPDRTLVYKRDPVVRAMSSRQFISGRGCPYSCTYCFNNAFNKIFASCGKLIRKKSVDYLLEEINETNKKFPFKTVVFQDDTFIANRAWLMDFCERYPSAINLPFTCNVRANLVTREVVQALKSAGCTGVNWSIESGCENLRNKVLKRNMSSEQIINTASLLNEYGIPNRIGNVIGIPGETHDQMLQTVELNITARPTLALANIFVPFPSLELTEYAIQNGHLNEEALHNIPKTFFQESILNFSPFEKKAMLKLLYLFPLFVRFPVIYRKKRIRNMLLKLNKYLLWIVYQAFYSMRMARLYKVKGSLRETLLILSRHLANL